jgi:hypothetical protein
MTTMSSRRMTKRQRGKPLMKIKDPMTGETKEKGVTAFGNESEKTGTLQSAADYSKHVKAKREATKAAKGGRVPLGGAPPIPEGKLQPIADAARAAAMPQPNFGMGPPPKDEELQKWAAPKTPPTPPPQQPPQLQGIGAAYPVNQALSTGQLERPASMKEAKGGNLPMQEGRKPVSPATAELLQQHHKASQEAMEVVPAEQEAGPALDPKKAQLDEAEKELAEGNRGSEEEQVLFPDFDSVRKARGPFEDEERKKVIEDRLIPMNFSDLITRKEIQQDVTIIPDQFSLGFRTVQEKEHLFCLQYLYEKTGATSAVYTEELFSVLKLVCSVTSINGALLPDHRDDVGDATEKVNREAFEKKLDIILGFPTPILADMGVQHNWFHDRVNKLFSVDKLKNG